jgi:hypothetical protein
MYQIQRELWEQRKYSCLYHFFSILATVYTHYYCMNLLFVCIIPHLSGIVVASIFH